MADRSTLLLVHAYAPPTPGGTPIVLHRLLSELPGIDLLTFTDLVRRRAVRAGGPLVLPGRYAFFRRKRPYGNRWKPVRWINGLLDVAYAVETGVRGAFLARRSNARWILSVADSGVSPVAGAVAARLARRPHLIMVFDLWEENAYLDVERWVAARLERRLWRGASRVLVYCEEAAEHYRAKHGIAAEVLRTPIDLPPADSPTPPRGADVLVAGAVYWAQEDAVRRLLAAAPAAGVPVTMVGEELDLRARGFLADRYEEPLSGAAFQARARSAGVLFVGLSFDSPHPDVVLTATPARFAEYMATGVPMLVHAPRGAHVIEYARRGNFATVVDTPDESALAAGLRDALGHPERAARALERARRDHDAVVVRARFIEILRAL